MFNIKYKVHLNLPLMTLNHMVSSFTYDTKVILPYEMYLIKVFHYFGIDLSGKESCSIHHTHQYDHFSYFYMR